MDDHTHEAMEARLLNLEKWQVRQNHKLDNACDRMDTLCSTLEQRMDRLDMVFNAKMDALEITLQRIQLEDARQCGARSAVYSVLHWLGPAGAATVLIAVFSYFDVF